ncbi:MAG TPA: hypothetical protein VE685_26005 [Thermoanaerobaculia bacterium]|nr:hypothetical protein [Thermoanaerobaculia bacterium]
MERDYASGAAGRRLRVSDADRGLEHWGGPLRVSGRAHVVVEVRPAGYQGSPDAIAENFRRFWDAHRAELDGVLGATARDEIADALTRELARSGYLPVSATAILAERFGLRNFEDDKAQIDLSPGMRLRIEEAVFQRPSGNITAEAGYVSVGPTYYYVTRRPDNKLAFDSFLGVLDRMGAAPTIDRQEIEDAWDFLGSVVDLHNKDQDFLYYRLIYPSVIPNSSLARREECQKVILVGANRREDLNWSCGDSTEEEEKAKCPNQERCRFVNRFRGRAMVVPEILITMNGEPFYVPVGTTLRNIAERSRNVSSSADRSTVKLFRRTDGSRAPVDLTAKSVNGFDPFDVPLLSGDRIVLKGGY